jgi:spore coat protein U-like protein
VSSGFGFAATPAFAACTVSSVGVNFGAYNPRSGTNLDGISSVVVDCDKKASGVVISLSTGGSGSYAQRRMIKGTSSLNYNLYVNSARSILWGDGTGVTSTSTIANIAKNGSVATTLYGRIPSGQTSVTAGTYGDTVSVTITF